MMSQCCDNFLAKRSEKKKEADRKQDKQKLERHQFCCAAAGSKLSDCDLNENSEEVFSGARQHWGLTVRQDADGLSAAATQAAGRISIHLTAALHKGRFKNMLL